MARMAPSGGGVQGSGGDAFVVSRLRDQVSIEPKRGDRHLVRGSLVAFADRVGAHRELAAWNEQHALRPFLRRAGVGSLVAALHGGESTCVVRCGQSRFGIQHGVQRRPVLAMREPRRRCLPSGTGPLRNDIREDEEDERKACTRTHEEENVPRPGSGWDFPRGGFRVGPAAPW